MKLKLLAGFLLVSSFAAQAHVREDTVKTYVLAGQEFQVRESIYVYGCNLALKAYPLLKKYGSAWQRFPEGAEILNQTSRDLAQSGYTEKEINALYLVAFAELAQLVEKRNGQ